MPTAPRRPATAAAVALAAALALGSAAASAATASDAPDPWRVLDAARESLAAAGAERAEFVQTYVPAGFSSGEEEVGRVALRLPDCLRWDYEEPFPKSFLICGDTVWSWNPEDGRGRTGSVERESQPGLDLLLLPVDELEDRYDARVTAVDGDRVTIGLEPATEADGRMAGETELTGATLVVDRAGGRLAELSYRDREGNRTTFVLSEYRPVARQGLFEAPEGIVWEGD